MNYNFSEVEKKWQAYWLENKTFKTEDNSEKAKFYGLLEFPYPSGAGLHIGHIKAYTSLEIVTRKKRMEGYNVLFPLGFDAFGLPTENYAIKTGEHPRVVTDRNIELFTKQLQEVGFSYDYDRTIDTTDPKYFKWTQWIFLQLFKHGLAYRDTTQVNYCPNCAVVLANEDSQGGKCDRCGGEVVQKVKEVWFLKISEYSEKMLELLEEVDYLPRIKTEQRNWIGKSVGASVKFSVKDKEDILDVFTTRPDTLYGVTFMVLAPEHPLLDKYQKDITNWSEITDYRVNANKKTEFERTQLVKDKTGVVVKGLTAINPLTKKEIPIFVADYVMMGYGTGAIMAVPGHDERDYQFAKKFDIPIIEVIAGGDISESAYTNTDDSAKLVNSDKFNGLTVAKAKKEILDYLEKENIGHGKTQYKMKDWAFNRQRYWGEPIPLVHCDTCGIVPVPESELPLELPVINDFTPGESGESPLSKVGSWVNTVCPKCGKPAKRETDTMPQWAGSSWYYLRFMDPRNDNALASQESLNYWGSVDWYNGGMEHATRHLIYSQFWHLFLYDIGAVPFKIPFKKRTAQGLLLAPDGGKMSKSKDNGVNPRDVIKEYGADVLRTYMLFLGEYEQEAPWNENGIKGVKRFLDKVYGLSSKVKNGAKEPNNFETILHQTIKKVSNDIDEGKYNTAIAALMTLSNEMNKLDEISTDSYESFIKLLNPYASHMCEEIWQTVLGHTETINHVKWPSYDEKKCVASTITMIIQVNGKLRDKIEVAADTTKEDMEKIALSSEKIQNLLNGKQLLKIIVVPGKLVNIVVK